MREITDSLIFILVFFYFPEKEVETPSSHATYFLNTELACGDSSRYKLALNYLGIIKQYYQVRPEMVCRHNNAKLLRLLFLALHLWVQLQLPF